MRSIFLDYNATTALEPEVWQAMSDVWARPNNASSVHGFGRQARQLVENARRKIAELAGAKNKRVIFTANGTEANNLALRGLSDRIVMVSAIEHASVLQAVPGAQIIPVTTSGVVDVVALDAMLQQASGKALVSVMLANNETGVIQPIKVVAELAHRYGALVHTDAVQAVGKIEVHMGDLDVDMMTISAHKLGGPQGAAALIADKAIMLTSQLKGGGQELGFRAGTENVAAIHGFAAAMQLVQDRRAQNQVIVSLRDSLEQALQAHAPQAVIFGKKQSRLPNTSYIAMPGVSHQTQLIHFDLQGISVSSGSACSSGKVDVSHVLLAMGVDDALAGSAVRVSMGPETTQSDVNAFVDAWKELYNRTSPNSGNNGHQEAA